MTLETLSSYLNNDKKETEIREIYILRILPFWLANKKTFTRIKGLTNVRGDGESGRSAYARRGMRNRIIYHAKILKTEDYCGIPRVSTPPNLGKLEKRNGTCEAPLKIHELRPPRRFLSHQIVMPGIGPLGDRIPSGSPDHAPRIRCRGGKKNLIRFSIFCVEKIFTLFRNFSFPVGSFYSIDML